MTRHFLLVICAALALAGCNGGNSDPDGAPPITQPGPAPIPDPTPDPTPGNPGDPPQEAVPTEIGSPIGEAVSRAIGPAGGTLSTADGALTVEVPAGAFGSEQTVAIQEITNEAHGAKGRAFRISPEGLHTPVPMTVRFRYTEQDLLGTTLGLLSIAYQDAARVWHVYAHPSIDAADKTLSVPTTHFSDWSMVSGAQILPHTARVKVGESLELRVLSCEREDLPEGEDLVVPEVLIDCVPSPLDAFSAQHWSVNGTEGGSAQFGTIAQDADRWSGKATYTAPATRPTPNTVSVSAQYTLNNAFELLVASVAIDAAIPSCEGFKTLERLAAHVSFDALSFVQTAEDRRHEGRHSGDLMATLRKIETGPTFGFWSSFGIPLQGHHVSINDAYSFTPPSGDGYTGTIVGSGAPHDALDIPSLVTLRVNYATCTFDVFAAFVVDGTIVHNGALGERPVGIGGLYIYDQPIVSEQADAAMLEGSLWIQASRDIERTGYVPLTEAATSWQATGSTRARWTIGPAP